MLTTFLENVFRAKYNDLVSLKYFTACVVNNSVEAMEFIFIRKPFASTRTGHFTVSLLKTLGNNP